MDLPGGAHAVLRGNWLGHSTKPAPNLYPHQWSWDSAFIAIGNAQTSWDRATEELTRLFEAQWANGMVPHIVFDSSATGYFPSSESWGSAAIADGPDGHRTSGICQPPVHATAVRRVAEIGAGQGQAVRPFLEIMYGALVRWHDYLHRVRAPDGHLVEIWHPWESGMDNAPVWDGPMANLAPGSDDIPSYRRVDTDTADADDRPTDSDYDRYMYLVEWLRRRSYAPSDPSEIPFRVHDVLFNSVLVRADHDLAWIADEIGLESRSHKARALDVATALDAHLWSDRLGLYVDRDVTTGSLIEVPIAGSLLALGVSPDKGRVGQLIAAISGQYAVPRGAEGGIVIPTVPLSDAHFEPTRYWRGPVWINIMWLLVRDLVRIGEPELAGRLRRGVFDLVSVEGCWEYYDPTTGSGRGTDSFSWTAALTIDLLADEI